MFLLVASLIFVLSFLVAVLLAFYAQRKGRLNVPYRLRGYDSSLTANSVAESTDKIGRFEDSLLDATFWDLVNQISSKRGADICSVNILWKVCAFLLASVTVYISCSILMFSIVIGFITVIVFSVVIDYLIADYRAKILNQLIHSLKLIADSIRAGYTFQQSLKVVVKEMSPPISHEFRRMVNELAVGMTLEEAFESMRNRIRSFEFDIFAVAILINQELGGNLAELLEHVADVLYERQRLANEMKVLSARGKSTAVILSILPILIGGIVYVFIDYDFLATITNDNIWYLVLTVGIILNLLGYILIRHIIDIRI